jgi:hypothetical protein
MARPTKFNPETAATIISAVRAGNYRTTAARLADIAPSTLYHWLKTGKEAEDGEFAEFFSAEKKAAHEAIAERVARIRRAAEGGQVIERLVVGARLAGVLRGQQARLTRSLPACERGCSGTSGD